MGFELSFRIYRNVEEGLYFWWLGNMRKVENWENVWLDWGGKGFYSGGLDFGRSRKDKI